MTSRKRVLVVHYLFPPLGGAGVPRILKFIKYLPGCGWDVTVVTSSLSTRWYGVRDESLLGEIPPEVHIVRAGEIPIAQIRRRASSPLRRLKVPGLAQYIGWPDEMAGWLPAATAAAIKAVRAARPDVIFSSSYPYTAHFVALLVHRLTGVPWVADFRDEWSNNPFTRNQPRLAGRLSAIGERTISRHAAQTVVVGDWFRLNGVPSGHSVEIPNGVDEDDLHGLPPVEPQNASRLRLTYVGSLYGEQNCAPVFAALNRLVEAGKIDPQRVELRLVGNVWIGAVDNRVRVPVVRVGYLDHLEALVEMRRSTALLLYVAPSSRAPTSKLYEYLASERPILCVTRPDNLAFRLVNEWHAGVTASPDDPGAVEAAVLKLYTNWLDGTLHSTSDVRERTLARYSRRRLTADLAQVLDDVAQGSSGAVSMPRQRAEARSRMARAESST